MTKKKETVIEQKPEAEQEPEVVELVPVQSVNQPQPLKGKPPKPFKPGVDVVPVPFTVEQHPLYSEPQAAKPI